MPANARPTVATGAATGAATSAVTGAATGAATDVVNANEESDANVGSGRPLDANDSPRPSKRQKVTPTKTPEQIRQDKIIADRERFLAEDY